ncbi:MAG TPA: hypothetical protein VI197_24845 [Polyangiaceae bacterium]
MRRWLRPLCLALLLGTGSPIESAHAQDAAELQAARDKFQKALALQTGGDWAGALALLKEVAAVRSTPQVRFNIALCEENLGQLVAAVGDYELAAADARAADETEVVEQAARRLDELKGRVPKVVVERGANADTATITLDGVALGDQVIGKSMNVDPGPHVITARAIGFDSFRATVRVDEAETKTIVVSLTPITQPKPAALPAPSGTAIEPRPPIAAYVAGGIGVASLITAGVMYGLAQSANKDLERACDGLSCPENMQDTGDRGETYTTLTNVGLGVGALGVGLGVVFYVTHERETASGFRPGAPGSVAGWSYVGRF